MAHADRRSTNGSSRYSAAVLLLLLWLTGTAARSQDEVFPRADAQQVGAEGLALNQALTLTLRNAPAPRLAAIASELAAGQATEAAGTFDPTGQFSLSYERSDGALRSSTLKFEDQRRELNREIIRLFTQVIQDLEQQLSTDGPGLVTCPEGLDQIIVEGFGNICVSARDRLSAEFFIELLSRRAEGNPEVAAIVDRYLELAYSAVRDTLIPIFEDTIADAEVRLELLGELPEVERRSEIALNLRSTRLFRNGMDLTYGVVLSGVKDNYDGKDIRAFLGGKNLPNTFESFAGLSLEVPLGKGGGRETVGAPETAAKLSHRASLLSLIHSLSSSTLGSLLAYWETAAAQQRLAILDEVVVMEEELYEVGRELVAADEIPRATLSLIEARLAAARRSAAQARRSVHEAKLLMADSVGLAVEAPQEAPGAAGGLPVAMSVAELDAIDRAALTSQAQSGRADLLAARKTREASRVLLRAAQRGLRRRLDLGLALGYSGLHESFDDRFYDPGAFGEALSQTNTGPSVFLSFNAALPFRNRVAHGELEQALALDRRSEIQVADLERRIRIRTLDALGSLREAAAEVERRDASERFHLQTLNDTLELFRAGERSLIDTILTEEQATLARLAVIDAHRAYAVNLARAMFETGTLMTYRLEPGNRVVIESVFPNDRLSSGS